MQAARHSALLICVPLSQNPMQACSVSPPPPGVLGADSLGLALDAVGEATVPAADVPVVDAPGAELPPLDSMSWAGGGERGATAGCWEAGCAMAEGGSGVSGMDVVWVAAAAAAAASD